MRVRLREISSTGVSSLRTFSHQIGPANRKFSPGVRFKVANAVTYDNLH